MSHTATEEQFEAFVWDDKFNTGVEVVDDQHHKLVDLINRLGAISTHQTSAEELGAILTELANYTQYHFDSEEKLMADCVVDTAHQALHIKAHQHFTAQVSVAARILMGGANLSGKLVAPLLKYLTNWLVQHILGTDRRMAQEILALQAGVSHDEAARKATEFMNEAANVLLGALNEMYGALGDKVLEVMEKNQELAAEREALNLLNSQLEQRVVQRTAEVSQLNQHLLADNVKLLKLNEELESTHTQLLQSEKMASVGQLAAGVAHEINNPVGFVNSNLGTLGKYVASLFQLIDAYEKESARQGVRSLPIVEQLKREMDFAFLVEDIPGLLKESQDGLGRVTRIVQNLMDFSHVDESTWRYVSLEQGMDSTLNVVANEIKYKAQVVKEYAGLPEIECMPSQLNQVFMNLLLNAVQAIDEHGVITVRTGARSDQVWVEVEDTGKGIAPELIKRIFDPFFTTKPVGQGTGLGLSLSYGIIERHNGRIEVNSEVGKGSTFRVWLPMRQAGQKESA